MYAILFVATCIFIVHVSVLAKCPRLCTDVMKIIFLTALLSVMSHITLYTPKCNKIVCNSFLKRTSNITAIKQFAMNRLVIALH